MLANSNARRTKTLAATTLGALALVLGATAAIAQGPVRAEIFIVLAKEEPGTIDPALSSMAALQRPPFNAFRSMQVLARPRLQLTPGRDQELDLPNGRKLRITLQQVMPDGRFRVRVSINRPNQEDYLPLLQVVAAPGDPFFVAGQGHQGGTLVIGIQLGG